MNAFSFEKWRSQVPPDKPYGAVFCLYLLVFAPLFYLFTYNSNYGFDALEYLTISRFLQKSYDLYAIIPSKSWAMYAYTNFVLSVMDAGYSHYSVSFLITCNVVLTLIVSYYVVSSTLSTSVGVLAAVIVGLCCFFTEMNYLEPEMMVGLLGLGAYKTATKSWHNRYVGLFLSGILIGCGMWFKSVASFYLMGICAFFLFAWIRERCDSGILLKSLFALIAGFILPQVIAAVGFYFVGRIEEHLEWTYFFSLVYYPSNIYWMEKFFLKLLWFHLLLIFCVFWSLRYHDSDQIFSDSVVLALFMACFSMLALLKTQASHYFFPAAIFFSIFIAVVLDRMFKSGFLQISFMKAAVAASIACVSLSWVLFYRDDAIARFYKIRDYSGERTEEAFIRERVPAGKHLLALNAGGVLYYYLADRYPNVPFINTEVQTTYYLSKYPAVLEEALNDDNLKMVIFDEDRLSFDDPRFADDPRVKIALERFYRKLTQVYKPERSVLFPYKFWLRKDDGL